MPTQKWPSEGGQFAGSVALHWAKAVECSKGEETAKRETSPSNGETKPLQDIQGGRYARREERARYANAQDTLDAQDPQCAPGMQNVQKLRETAELYRASVYSNDSEAGGSRLVESE
ncbi:hypothetical protein M378DRAFT_14882 [Amanita muscaria Koide BX008]|uniref:Uncharacterized protein n=1 Tax=Amanita muscaria (strain Koide BX008) TaxID=946122 RepID=A0A0C2WDC5_AMAMK|nr:hypothetical protein M378DRAFT_14882 [Amanita muscaria Koide BX008]